MEKGWNNVLTDGQKEKAWRLEGEAMEQIDLI
jgi:hypothetical protein